MPQPATWTTAQASISDIHHASFPQPPYGDIDDRIRAIAQGLGLRTVLWKYNSQDWQFGTAGVTVDTVDAQYQALMTDAKNGKFNTVRGFCVACSRETLIVMFC